MELTESLLRAAVTADGQARRVSDEHPPRDGCCPRCRTPWPCDAARMAGDALGLLAEIPVVLEPDAGDPGRPDATTELAAWRSAQGIAERAYHQAFRLVPVDRTGHLPDPDAAGLNPQQRRALRELASAEARQLHCARRVLDHAR